MSVIKRDGTIYVYNFKGSIHHGQRCKATYWNRGSTLLTFIDWGNTPQGTITVVNEDIDRLTVWVASATPPVSPHITPLEIVDIVSSVGKVKVQLPGVVHCAEIKGTLSNVWNVGDECWISNDKGLGMDDDAFCMIGDDLTMRIAALYDNKAGQAMAVVEHVNGGPSRCFVIDMLREHKDGHKESSAIKTLEAMNYSYSGAELWKPPLGKTPDYIKPSAPS